MIIKVYDLKDLKSYAISGLLILTLSTILYFSLKGIAYKKASMILLTFIYPLIFIGQGVFMTIKDKDFLIPLVISILTTIIVIYLYFSPYELMYCFLYIILCTIAAVFTKEVLIKKEE